MAVVEPLEHIVAVLNIWLDLKYCVLKKLFMNKDTCITGINCGGGCCGSGAITGCGGGGNCIGNCCCGIWPGGNGTQP